ncbi:hypothetical protein MBLNU230_g1851t1 [Neophaeotheca triangularis]
MPPKHNLKRKREINAQPARKALRNGELDVDKFLSARQYEIRALEQGMAQSKAMLTKRAFQQVPKDLRRRSASHNAKRVPKRLQRTARKEMADDNTPRKGRVGMLAGMKGLKGIGKGKIRLRLQKLQTARKLRELGRQNKRTFGAAPNIKQDANAETTPAIASTVTAAVTGRRPRVKKATLATAPAAQGKHRKRQAHKSWLPTHIFHAKRAHMTAPSNPLWRFAIPTTPTTKAYRPTHRSFSQRGAIAWDTSYMSTISLEGREQSLEGVLKGFEFGTQNANGATSLCGSKRERWREGKRGGQAWLFERDRPMVAIAPATVFWNPAATEPELESNPDQNHQPADSKLRQRKLFIRVHPSAFHQVWEEVVRLAKIAKPSVSVEDLRYEIGSIEVTGPASTEALLGALSPTLSAAAIEERKEVNGGGLFKSLAGLSDPAMLPANAVLGFNVRDSRLHHPPRTVELDQSLETQHKLLKTLSAWPMDKTIEPMQLFERKARTSTSLSLPSQKAVNRRRALAKPGEYPEAHTGDPSIPIILHASSVCVAGSNDGPRQGSWTLLMPWKCLQPVWYGIQYYPLSTGGQPRFGGIRETQQMHFERGIPWFPGDFPGTKGGWEWELRERERRKDEWSRRPKGKRTNWEAVDLGKDRKGEIGLGWACDWERLFNRPEADISNAGVSLEEKTNAASKSDAPLSSAQLPFVHVPASQAVGLVKPLAEIAKSAIDPSKALTTVHFTLVGRGTPRPCARVYRLPSNSVDPALRKAWLALCKPHQKSPGAKHSLPKPSKDAPPHMRQRHLAASLLEPARAGGDEYPVCPGEEDLIGFVTTGNYDLGAGKGTAIGNVVVGKVREGLVATDPEMRLCVVRNAGEGLARLATWTPC